MARWVAIWVVVMAAAAAADMVVAVDTHSPAVIKDNSLTRLARTTAETQTNPEADRTWHPNIMAITPKDDRWDPSITRHTRQLGARLLRMHIQSHPR